MTEGFTSNGTITNREDNPVAGLLVRAFDKGLPSLGPRHEQRLGEDAITDADGRYRVAFTEKDFQNGEARRGRKIWPDVFIRVFDRDTLLGESDVHHATGYQTRIDLSVILPHLAEYERLVREITPALQGIAIADLTDEDLAFLNRQDVGGAGHRDLLNEVWQLVKHDTAKTVDRLTRLRMSAQFARQAKVLPEACYAWVRLLDPSDLDRLVATSDVDLRDALDKAIAEDVVSAASLAGKIEAAITSLKHHHDVGYQAVGELVDDGTGAPVSRPGIRVQVFDVNGLDYGSHAINLGTSSVDERGRFSFVYPGPPIQNVALAAVQRRFRFKILDPTGQAAPETEISTVLGQRNPIRISVPASVAHQPSATISDLATAATITIPVDLVAFLSARNIRTFADIRRMGGLSELSGLPVSADHQAVAALEAHADLSRISDDIAVNQTLIGRTYARVSDIADESQGAFVAATRDVLGDLRAVRMHIAARVQTAVLDNLATGIVLNGVRVTGPDGMSGDLLAAPSCECEDCQAAVSPAAYLVDLLGYVVKHVQNNGLPLSLGFLEATLHQPFGGLPTDCDAVSQRVRQVRICVEVLRDFLKTIALSANQIDALRLAERNYRLGVYLSLLTRIGTSYTEIRSARTATDVQRRALAEKLGIGLSAPRLPGGDELDRLFLDENAAQADPSALTEQVIERLFGLADTTRDPLSVGAKLGDDEFALRLVRWRLTGVQWGRNTDPNGYVFFSQTSLNPVSTNVKAFKDSLHQQLVARGALGSAQGTITLIPENASDLGGTLDVASSEPGSTIAISAVPEFLSWRLRQLRTIWSLQDQPDDSYSAQALPVLPLVDPDLVGPDDFRAPFPKASAGAPTKAFDVWLARRAFVDQTLARLEQDRESKGLLFILHDVLGNPGPMPDLDALLQAITSGSKSEVESATAMILDLSLQVDEFLHLMVVRAKDTSATTDPRNDTVSEAEWRDVYSILTQATKRSRFAQWRTEEVSAGVILGSEELWPSIREPVAGDWPLIRIPAVPLIDPDLQSAKDLPEDAAGKQALDAWNQRRVDLIQIVAALQNAREGNALTGFETMLRLAIGSPTPGDPLQHDPDALRTNLASSNSTVVQAAKTAITQDLHLSLEGFTNLMDVRDKDRQADPTKKPTAVEYAVVYALLLAARKAKHEYPAWIADDTTRFGPEAAAFGEDVAYWKARKASLPRWRASAEARLSWQQARQMRTGPPVIDPDLVTEEDLRDPFPLQVAFDTLQTRKTFVDNLYQSVLNSARTLVVFDAALASVVGIVATDFVELDGERQNGVAVQPRLDQLDLSNRAFGALLSLRALLAQAQPVLDAEWQQFASILAQVKKVRQFSAWRSEERTGQIILGPDAFLAIANPAFADSAALDSWRAPWSRRRTWQETLQSRIDQENDLATTMRDASSEVEARWLPSLRDALVMAGGPSGTSSEVRGTWLAERLLIATDNYGCEHTTRIEQALETLQGLVYGLKAGQFKNGLEFSDISATSWETGRIDLFALGPDRALWHRWIDGPKWHDWESLGGQLQFGPGAVARGVGQLDVFACGRNNQLIWKSFSNGVWSEWIPLGGVITAAPAAVSAAPGRIDIFARGSDGALYSHAIQDNVSLGWQLSLGGFFNSAPAAISSAPGHIDVFVWGGDNALYRHVVEGSVSVGWQPSLGGVLTTHPAAVSSAPGRVDVFVRGTDNALYQFALQDGMPLGWQPSLGGYLASPPAAASSKPADITVYVRGGNGALYERRFTPVIWIQWQLVDTLALSLVDLTNFEEEWKWIGSYATWRSAMFVFLYPENICAPSLRRRYSPGFGNLIGKIRSAHALTEEQACNLAHEYATSYEDIAKLQIEASCEAVAIAFAGTECAPIRTEYKRLVFLFARGGLTSRPYWSTYDTEDPSGFAQAFWEAVPGIDAVHQIVSSMVYEISGTVRRIYLFIRTTDDLLQFLTLDLETLSWSDSKDLGLPPGNAADIKSVGLYSGPGSPPALVLWAPASVTYYERFLNRDGTGWEDGDWSRFVLDLSAQQQASPVADLFAAIGGIIYVRQETDSDIITVHPGQVTSESGTVGNNAEFLGLADFFFFERLTFERLTDGTIAVMDLETNTGPNSIGSFPLLGLNKVASHTKPDRGNYEFVYAYERKNRTLPFFEEQDGVYLRYDNARSDGQEQRRLIAPRALSSISDQFSIPSRPDDGTVTSRRASMRSVYYSGGDSGTHRTYPSEAYYFVPIALAQALQSSGEYEAALGWFRTVYDYTAPVDDRKSYYGLVFEESLPDVYSRGQEWLLDPLDPHAIAATRQNTYTRYTIQAIVRCMLDYADAEFTRDTSESNARARTLYRAATELLAAPEVRQDEQGCKTLVERISTIGDGLPRTVATAVAAISRRLGEIHDSSILAAVTTDVRAVLASKADWSTRLIKARTLADEAVHRGSVSLPIGVLVRDKILARERAISTLLRSPGRATALADLASSETMRFTTQVAGFLSLTAKEMESRRIALPWLTPVLPMAGLATLSGPGDDPVVAVPASVGKAPGAREDRLEVPPFARTPRPPIVVPSFSFCIPFNPIIDALRSHAKLNLYKLSSCRNIAGLQRVLEPYSVPTDAVSGLPTVGANGQLALPGVAAITPTQYRYAVLIERAKEMVRIAEQMEASMLSSIEKQDAEAYSLLKARQDLKLADAGVQLQALRQKQAGDSVTLARLQQARAQLQVQHFQELLDKGESQLEKDAITYLGEAADRLADASTFALMAAGGPVISGAAAGAVAGPAGIAAGAIAGALSSGAAIAQGLSLVAAKYSTRASILSTLASFERRQEDWRLSEGLARQDVAIGAQQVIIANDQVDIVNEEKAIAGIQATNAKDTVAFLNNKFTNVELYEWMSGVLQNVYSFFLKEATATATLAENQLAFQRQEPPPGFIQSDYWNAPSDLSSPGSLKATGPDRRGLTGSARLLQDIYKLDEYAFATNKRKYQLAKTMSLARLAPIEFQQFRESGLLRFATHMELFDRDFLGHYLRLITRVRTSIIALIPPGDGIHATLSSTGLSRVVIGVDTFQTSAIKRDPESVALSSPSNATGVFELDQTGADMLLPFEGCGVDGSWEFRLPKASNLFDYSSISDVLITFEYTALNSFDYQRQLQQALDPSISAEMPYGFRNQFADQWYDLHNPDQTPTPMTVRFTTVAEDFPPNLVDLRIQQIALYFSRADEHVFEIPVSSLRFKQRGSAGYVGGSATTVDGIISTRRGNAGSWASMLGKAPYGDWELALPEDEQMRAHFANEDIQDILFVVTYVGRTSDWV